MASVERKSLPDFVSSVTDGRLRFALGELPHFLAQRWSSRSGTRGSSRSTGCGPAVVLDGLAELQVRYPNVPIVFCETRSLAEEWTYRYLAAARVWAETETVAVERIEQAILDASPRRDGPLGRVPIERADGLGGRGRAWAMAEGMGGGPRSARPEIWVAWRRRIRIHHLTDVTCNEDKPAPGSRGDPSGARRVD